MPNFECTRCGACCSHLRAFGDLYSDLDNGRGVCRFYDQKSHLCLCYEHRPLKCRVREGYVFFSKTMSFEEYILKTRQGCLYLRGLSGQLPSDLEKHEVDDSLFSSSCIADGDSWRNNRGDKSGITRDEPGHTGKTLCNFIAWDENRRGGKSLPFSSLLDGVRVWPESLFRLSTHHGSGSVGGVLPHLGKPTVGPLAVVFFHR